MQTGDNLEYFRKYHVPARKFVNYLNKNNIKVEIPSWRPDVSLDEDLPSRIPSVRSLSAIETILQNLKHYLLYERNENE